MKLAPLSTAAAVGIVAASASARTAAAFAGGGHRPARRIPTTLHLEDHIADMIDGEVRRLDQKHYAEADRILRQQQWAQMEPQLPENYDFAEEDLSGASVPGFTAGVDRSRAVNPRRRKDEKMAVDDPMRYCADRCVTTGNCDVFEDMFEMGPSEVIQFCNECVLSEDEEPCDIPEAAFGGGDDGVTPIEDGGLDASGLHP